MLQFTELSADNKKQLGTNSRPTSWPWSDDDADGADDDHGDDDNADDDDNDGDDDNDDDHEDE